MENAPCLFIKNGMIIICYIDNLFLLPEQGPLIKNIKQKLGSTFQLKHVGSPTLFLGMNLKWHSDGPLSIWKNQLIKKLLIDRGMEKAKHLFSPIDQPSMVNNTNTATLIAEKHATYRITIRSLMYFYTWTGPGLAVTAGMLASLLQERVSAYLVRGKWVLRYLRGTAHYEMKI